MDQKNLDAKIDAEIARLQGVISAAQNDIAQLQHYRNLLKSPVIAAITGTGEMQPLAAHVSAVAEVVAKNSGRLRSKRDRVLDAAEKVLSDGVRRLSRDLLPEIEKQGVKVGGKDPVNGLAVYLSREKDRFQTDQKAGGWTLTRLANKRKPNDVTASSGFLVPTGVGHHHHPTAG